MVRKLTSVFESSDMEKKEVELETARAELQNSKDSIRILEVEIANLKTALQASKTEIEFVRSSPKRHQEPIGQKIDSEVAVKEYQAKIKELQVGFFF